MHDESLISIAVAWTVLGLVIWVFFFVKLAGPKAGVERIMNQYEAQQRDHSSY